MASNEQETDLPNARRLPAWKSSISCRSPCSICRTSATSVWKVWCWTGRSMYRASIPVLNPGPDRIIPGLPSKPLNIPLLCTLGVPLLGGEGSRGKEVTGEELGKEFWLKVVVTSVPSVEYLGPLRGHWGLERGVPVVSMFLPSGALTTNLRIPGLGRGPPRPGVSRVLWAAKGVRQQWREAQGQAMHTSAGKQNVSEQTKQQRINDKKIIQVYWMSTM